MSQMDEVRPAPAQAVVSPRLPPSALVDETPRPPGLGHRAPGLMEPALVPPLASAPSEQDLDPCGEVAALVLEPEASLDPDNAVLEVAVLWQGQLRDVHHLNGASDFTVGEDPRARVILRAEELPSDRFVLLRQRDGASLVRCPPGLRGVLQRDGVEQPLAAAAGWADAEDATCREVPLPLDALARIELGEITLQLRHVPRPAPVPRALLETMNYGWLNVLLVSLFAHVGFLATAALYPYDTRALEESLFTQPNRFSQFVLQPPQPRDNPLLARLLQAAPGASSARSAGNEGLSGRRGAPDTGKRRATPADRPTDEQTVQRAVSQLFGARGGGMGVGSVLGAELGGELIGALGAVHGVEVGDSGGLGGLGTRGSGPGGGGSSTTTFGVGRIRTAGHGDGSEGYGASSGGLRPRAQRDVEIVQGAQVLSGSLDKELIRQVIADNLGQIRYCYTRELAASPGLHGKVVVSFVIGGTGRVTSARVIESTLDSAEVEGCVARKVQGWTFPRPRGGGIVVVNYPFLFKQSG